MSYPTTLDSFATPGTTLASNPHSSLHTAETTALTAIEAKLGVDNSAVTTSIDYKLKSTSSISPGHKHATADITDAGTYISTGIIVPYVGTSAPTGFLLCNGQAVSRTTYATLFALTSTTYGIGDGSTTFNVPNLGSRIIMGAGTGTKVATFASRASNVITVTGLTNASNNEFQTGQAVVYHTTSGAITGLTNDTTYYVIRTGNLTFSLATTLANAQNNTVIGLSSDGSGTQTFTKTLTARTLGDTGGEENHAMSSTEILAHTHDIAAQNGGGGAQAGMLANTGGGASGGNISPNNVQNLGGNTAMNVIQPYIAFTYIIKT